MCVCVDANLGRCGVFAVLQRQRQRMRAPLASERHPGADGSDVAHSDHSSPHTHQPSEHAGAQRPQRSQRFIVVQPVG